ncbi:12730_t:CDS:2 [Funneliformis geosporum]|nr:12730_t:CDS:2 [Funneliformis geosporum]
MVARNIIRTTDTTIFRTDLALAYKSFRNYTSLINEPCKSYEYASYIQDDNYTSEIKYNQHKNDIVMIQMQDFDKIYAIIKAIFKHKDEIQNVHFMHNCSIQYEEGNHDPNNNQYLKNSIFFKAI